MTMGSGADPEVLQRVNERAQGIRSELLDLLQAGPALSNDLLPTIQTAGVTESEVDFQLGRLTEEGKTFGRPGDPYRLL
jgi:hypothetical protein